MKKGEREVVRFSFKEHVDEAKCLVCNKIIDMIRDEETKCDCDPINVCKCWYFNSTWPLGQKCTHFEIPPHGHMRLVVDGDVCEQKGRRFVDCDVCELKPKGKDE